jgi:predicted amidohydrolase YtcJ
LAVLDRDYLRVKDSEMRKIRPILTIVAGKVVHDTGVLQVDKNGHDEDDDD